MLCSISCGLASRLPPHMLLLWHLPQSMEEVWGRWALRLRGEKLSQSRGTKSIGFFSILRLFIALYNPERRHRAANSDKMTCCILLEESCLLERSLCFQTYMFRHTCSDIRGSLGSANVFTLNFQYFERTFLLL